MNSVWETILFPPIVPTVFPMSTDVLCPYIRILSEEGYSALEVLSRPADDALKVVSEIAEHLERKFISLGIGTVLTEKDALRAVSLKPDFLVSPAFSNRVLRVASEAGIPYIPGVRSFQDVQNVMDAFEDVGLEVTVLKLCPVHGLDAEYLRMLHGCFPGISFCPAGSRAMESLEDYVYWKTQPAIAAPMGANFIPRGLLENRDFDAVRKRLREIQELSTEAGHELKKASEPSSSR